MPSKALVDWRTDACAAFDEIENAHRAVGGTRPGRRFVTQQLNYAYVTLLAARFQGFAQALHSQTADEIALGAHNLDYRLLLQESLTSARLLDRGNPHPASIATDFERFGIDVWSKVDVMRKDSGERRKKLAALITWRNAISHHDIDAKLSKGALDPLSINLDTCRAGAARSTCSPTVSIELQQTGARNWVSPGLGDTVKELWARQLQRLLNR